MSLVDTRQRLTALTTAVQDNALARDPGLARLQLGQELTARAARYSTAA
jgi:hypothetical protein